MSMLIPRALRWTSDPLANLEKEMVKVRVVPFVTEQITKRMNVGTKSKGAKVLENIVVARIITEKAVKEAMQINLRKSKVANRTAASPANTIARIISMAKVASQAKVIHIIKVKARKVLMNLRALHRIPQHKTVSTCSCKICSSNGLNHQHFPQMQLQMQANQLQACIQDHPRDPSYMM